MILFLHFESDSVCPMSKNIFKPIIELFANVYVIGPASRFTSLITVHLMQEFAQSNTDIVRAWKAWN